MKYRSPKEDKAHDAVPEKQKIFNASIEKFAMKKPSSSPRKVRKSRTQRPLQVSALQRFSAYTVSLLMACYPFAGYGMLPSGPELVHGDVSIADDGTVMNLDQATQAAIINWDVFSIGADNAVNVDQPNSAATMLSRVVGGDISSILGARTANGNFYLVNPNGV